MTPVNSTSVSPGAVMKNGKKCGAAGFMALDMIAPPVTTLVTQHTSRQQRSPRQALLVLSRKRWAAN